MVTCLWGSRGHRPEVNFGCHSLGAVNLVFQTGSLSGIWGSPTGLVSLARDPHLPSARITPHTVALSFVTWTLRVQGAHTLDSIC